MDRRPAVGRRQRHVDGIERLQPQDIFGVDRVGIAQPVLDRGDRQFQRPCRARRFRRGLLDRLDLVGLVEFARRNARNASPAAIAAFQRSSPATASSRCRKREATAGAPPTLAAWLRITSSLPSNCAKSCADKPMRRSGRSRPSACRIGRLSQGSTRGAGGQTPFDQSAEDDAIGLRQPRFQRTIDPQLRIRDLRPPHHAVAERGLKHLRIIAERDHQTARRALAEQIVERRRQHRSLMALEGERRAIFVARQFDQYVAMLLGERGKIMRL